MDRMVFGTLRGRIMDGSRQAGSQTLEAIAKWSVYALTVLAAANVLAIELLSQWRQTAISFLSVFAVG